MRSIILALKKRIQPFRSEKNKKRKGYSSREEALRWKGDLEKYCRTKLGTELNPLQSDPKVVPPFEVAVQVQAPNKCDPNTFFATGYRQTVEYLEELAEFGMRPDRMKTILEFGVGTGRLLVHYLPFKARLFGCDVNPQAVEWTQKTLGHAAEIRLNGAEPPLPYEDGAFDYIYANSVFTHIPFAMHERWVAELARILKPGGCLIATVHDLEKIRELDAPGGWYERNVEKGLHMNTYFSKERLLGIWRPYFGTVEIRPRAPQTHVIAVKRVPFEKTQSVLSKARSADVVMEPFPHVVIRNALDPALYEKLAAEFPADEVVMNGKLLKSNAKYFYGAAKALADDRISPLWKDFFRTHASDDFYREAVALFGSAIKALYPDLEIRLKKKTADLRTGIRRRDASAEAAMDCQFAINSPVTERVSSVRGPHVDGAKTLFQGLLYFKDTGDEAGGNLELYRFREGVDPSSLELSAVDPALVEKAASVVYEKNTLIFFLNSIRSLHGVSPRAVTPRTRRYFNVLCDLPVELFQSRAQSRPETVGSEY